MRTKRAPEAAAFFLLISSLTQLAGCYGVQQMNLIYPPEASAVATELSGNTEHTSSSSPSKVVVEVFDARAEKDRLGGDFDGWFREGTT